MIRVTRIKPTDWLHKLPKNSATFDAFQGKEAPEEQRPPKISDQKQSSREEEFEPASAGGQEPTTVGGEARPGVGGGATGEVKKPPPGKIEEGPATAISCSGLVCRACMLNVLDQLSDMQRAEMHQLVTGTFFFKYVGELRIIISRRIKQILQGGPMRTHIYLRASQFGVGDRNHQFVHHTVLW